MKKTDNYILFLYLLIIAVVILCSCDTCKHTPTYGGNGKMTRGHGKEVFAQKASKNPYYNKPVKRKTSSFNPYKNR